MNQEDLKVSAMSRIVNVVSWGSNNTQIGCIVRGRYMC